MELNKIGGLVPNPFQEINKKPESNGFKDVLSDFIGDVNAQQFDAKNLTEGFIKGEDVELHEVMIAGAKARTSLDLLMEIRNKTVDMYKELNRMQI